LEAIENKRQIIGRGMFRIGKPVFVEVFDEVLALMRRKGRIVDGSVPIGFGFRIAADVGERITSEWVLERGF